jgi:predicted kinase
MHTSYIVCGSPGAGKSTYARQLAAAIKATLLDIDTVTERLIRVALVQSGHHQDDRDSRYFKRNFREPIYETLFDIAKENLSFKDVVIVGPFTKEMKDPAWPASLHRVLGSSIRIHYVQCERELRRRRLVRRGNARDLAKLNDWENHVQYYGDESPPLFEHVLIDGSDPDAARRVLG